MMNMLEEAVNSLRSAQASHLSVPIVYRRIGGMEKSAQAILGKTVFRSQNDYGAWVRTEARDFIVLAADLPDPPSPGDEIVYAGRTYEVLAPNDEPVWRWSDPWYTARRIHTKWSGGNP